MQCYYYSNESSSFMRTSIGCFCEGAFSNFISCDTVSRYTRCFSSGTRYYNERTCRRMEKFCGRFSLAGKEEIRSKTHNMRLYSAKMCTTNLTQTVCLRLCGELFCFSGLTRSFSWTHGSGACPAPASSTAFSGQRPGPAGTAPCGCWPCPRLKNGGIQSHSSADQRRLPPE